MQKRQLGMGYSSSGLSATGNRCIDFKEEDIHLVDASRSVVTFNGLTTYSDISRSLGADLSANIKICYIIGCLNFGVSLDFYHYSRETDYSKSFIYSINTQLPNIRIDFKKYGLSVLTKEAQIYYNQSLQDFNNFCGDSFIFQEQLGAGLYISTKLNFVTKTEKDSFTISGSGFLGSILQFLNLQGSGINEFFFHERASLSVSVMQNGGDKSLLKSIFPSFTWHNDDFATFNCFATNSQNIANEIKQCKEIMNGLLKYATNDFPKLINNNDLETAAVTGIYKKSYNFIGIDPGSTGLDPETISIRNNLLENYENILKDQLFYSKLTTVMPESRAYFLFGDVKTNWNGNYIDNSTLSSLANLDAKLVSAGDETKQLLQTCYNNVQNCVAHYPSVDTELLESFKYAYFISSKCGNTLFGPRYLLAIAEGNYLENSNFLSSNQTIVASFSISLSVGNITIYDINENHNCGVTISKEENYNLIEVFKTTFFDDCAQYICPSGVIPVGGSADVEFIRIETPI